MLALAAATACSDITLSPTHVIAIEVDSSTPTVEQGDTVRLGARALNALGDEVPNAPITWAVLDTGALPFQLDPSGLVHGNSLGSGRVQASTGSLRSDAITVTVTPVPDTAAATTPLRVLVPPTDIQSSQLSVSVYAHSATGSLVPIPGKTVIYQVAEPPGSTGFFLTVSDTLPGADPRRVTTATTSTGTAFVRVRRRNGETPPDSVLVDATALTAHGATVAGTPVRFVVVFNP
jgi:hypothetical protein